MAGAYGRRRAIAASIGSLRPLHFARSRLVPRCSRSEEHGGSLARPAQRRISVASSTAARDFPTLAAVLFGCSRIALVVRLLRRRSQTMKRVCSFLLSTPARDFPTLAAVR